MARRAAIEEREESWLDQEPRFAPATERNYFRSVARDVAASPAKNNVFSTGAGRFSCAPLPRSHSCKLHEQRDRSTNRERRRRRACSRFGLAENPEGALAHRWHAPLLGNRTGLRTFFSLRNGAHAVMTDSLSGSVVHQGIVHLANSRPRL